MFRSVKPAQKSRLLLRRLEDRLLFSAAPDILLQPPSADGGELDCAPQHDALQVSQDTAATADASSTATPDATVGSARQELAIIDPALQHHEQLVDDLLGQNDPLRTLEVVLLDAQQNGARQVHDILSQYQNLDAVHLISHGDHQALRLGSTWLTPNSLSSFSSDLTAWSEAFADGGDLLIYGCNVASGPSGQSLVDSMAAMLGVDVAASSDNTGHVAAGGDWTLEYATGPIDTSVALSDALQQDWIGRLAVGPDAQLSLPTQARLGENLSFTVTFQNTGQPGDIGYGPFIDLVFPVNGADGAAGRSIADGLSFVSADYLGATVRAIVLTFPDDDGAGPGTTGTVQHPFALDNTGTPLTVRGTAGDTLVVLELPLGSFTPDQPAAQITIGASMSNLADAGAPLVLATRAGFRFGTDALDNPTSDPSILSDNQTDSSAWVEQASLTPTLMSISKTIDAPEAESVTGPNYVRQFRVEVDIPTGQTVTNLDIIGSLPDNIVFQSLDVLTSSDPAALLTHNANTLSTSLPQNGAQLIATANAVTGRAGTDITMVYSFYVAEFDADNNRVIPLSGEDDQGTSLSTNQASVVGDWTPIDPRDLGGTDNAVAGPAQATLDDKAIAVQKSVQIVNDTGVAGESPGDTLEYTVQFQISDYFTFGDLLVSDTFQDGQLFDFGFGASLTATDFQGTAIGRFTLRRATEPDQGETLVVDETRIDRSDDAAEDPLSDGSTTLTFDVSGALRQLNDADGVLQGGLTDGPVNLGAAVGTLRFRTVIQDDFADTFPSGDRSVDQGDAITNNLLSISGTVRQNAESGAVSNVIGPAPDGRESDESLAGVNIVHGNLAKDVYAVNGLTTLPVGPSGKVTVAPGDVVTFRITYTLPTSDFETLKFTDYLPLPIFDVTDPDADGSAGPGWTFDLGQSFDATPPIAGVIEFGPNDTFFRSVPGSSNTSDPPDYFAPPELNVDTAANSIEIVHGTYDDPGQSQTQIELLLSVAVQDDPFADGLFLTNIVRAEEGSTNSSDVLLDRIIQVQLQEPQLSIRKGVVSSDSITAAFDNAVGPAGVIFATAGSAGAPFSGTIHSTGLASQPIDANISGGIDAGDIVRFAIVLENTGNSLRGARADVSRRRSDSGAGGRRSGGGG